MLSELTTGLITSSRIFLSTYNYIISRVTAFTEIIYHFPLSLLFKLRDKPQVLGSGMVEMMMMLKMMTTMTTAAMLY